MSKRPWKANLVTCFSEISGCADALTRYAITSCTIVTSARHAGYPICSRWAWYVTFVSLPSWCTLACPIKTITRGTVVTCTNVGTVCSKVIAIAFCQASRTCPTRWTVTLEWSCADSTVGGTFGMAFRNGASGSSPTSRTVAEVRLDARSAILARRRADSCLTIASCHSFWASTCSIEAIAYKPHFAFAL